MGLLKNLFNGLGKSSFSNNNISDISDGIENNPSSKNVILSYGGGFTDSVMGFQSWGLNNSQFGKHINKLHSVKDIKSFNLENIRTRFYKDNRSVTQFENPLDTNIYTPYKSYYGNSSVNNNVSNVENIFNPDINSLLLMNNYKFQYKEPIKVKIDEYADKDGNKKAKYVPIKVVPALFNPLYMVQSIGMARNTPLLNLRNYEGYGDGTTYSNNVDTSDCTIRTLVKLSRLDYGELGTARYKYADFMYCKDLGKVSNNHLITLRKYPYPIGDNITGRNSALFNTGDVGRLITWFDTEDNKIEDILSYSFKATWKELTSERQDIDSKAGDEARGPIGKILNTLNPAANKSIYSGGAGGGSNLSIFPNVQTKDSGYTDIQRAYDKNKVYTPFDTIQDTHTYEGKLQFAHEFKLTFSYKLRAYDNINPKSAFLDLIGNILEVTYRRGRFWGGERKLIGMPENKTGWQKANAFLDNTFMETSSVFNSILNGTFDFKSIISKVTAFISGGLTWDSIKNFGQQAKETAKEILSSSQVVEGFLGSLKNKLGRPSVYATDSLLTGDNVGLWHVTIGNPRNPIMSMGNLILTDTVIQHLGPLGLDDFPTELKVTVTLKHARSRDAVDISRMYTSGENTIYYSFKNPGLKNWIAGVDQDYELEDEKRQTKYEGKDISTGNNNDQTQEQQNKENQQNQQNQQKDGIVEETVSYDSGKVKYVDKDGKTVVYDGTVSQFRSNQLDKYLIENNHALKDNKDNITGILDYNDISQPNTPPEIEQTNQLLAFDRVCVLNELA